ncbi:MAG: histidinol dehydrogenase [Bryobacterales bacterium]|nr:histidinol dehydrogenase [Bryobacterales bacterium]
MLRIIDHRQAEKLLRRRTARLAAAERAVAPIIEDVRRHGDRALLKYARRLDGLPPGARTVLVPPEELEAGLRSLSPQFRRAARDASQHIRDFAKLQLPAPVMVRLSGGQRAGYVVRPLDAMAAYVPSGRYPLPSTVLMTVIPAQVAKVPRIFVASPKPSPEILGVARLLGVDRVFRMGGAQAIAALAFGTGTVPRVDRIAGPGNIYVTAAKKLLAGEVGIDFVAGPTEILLIAEEGDPQAIAADMLAQAEHDVDAAAILVTTSRRLAASVAGEVNEQLRTLPTAPTARVSLRRNSAIIVVPSLDRAVELSNRFAPEHLNVPDASLVSRITAAGSIFVGHYSPEAAGDYASGPNHVLPTSGLARVRAGLSSADFVKVISVQQLDRSALRRLAPTITTLARAEGLEAHARSVEVRLRG